MGYFTALKWDTATALTGSASYTGGAVHAFHFSAIVGTCYADKAGTLRCEFSNDNTNWDGRHDDVTYIAEDKVAFSFEVIGEWARLVFVNGASAQSTFRLQGRLRSDWV